ncbi:MAG: alpha/beta fold hydrolase [Pyrinomonadaceae bacterium]
MAEPSIAGMRVEGEKLSPDGTKVIYLWNAEGKLPRDLYMVSTSGGSAAKILSVSDLPVPTRTPEKETKLDYGLVLRDEFVKERENQLGNFEWSPDSKKLLFSHGGDLYLLFISETPRTSESERKWISLKKAISEKLDLVPVIITDLKSAAVQEPNLFASAMTARRELSFSLIENSTRNNVFVFESLARLSTIVEEMLALNKIYPSLNGAKPFQELKDENRDIQSRIDLGKKDYDNEGGSKTVHFKRLTKTLSGEIGARFIDVDRILFSQSGNIFVLDTVNVMLTQLTKEADPAKFVTVGNVSVSKDGKLAAYVMSDSSKFTNLVVPNYLGELTAAPPTRRGWSEQRVFVTPTDGSRETPFEIKLPKSEGVGGFRSIKWAADNASLIVDRGDKDTKRRQLYYVYNVGSKGEQTILITEETDEKWIAPLSSIVEPNPKDASELFFASEKDGYNHLYLAKLEALKPEPNTTGEIRGENPSGSVYSSNVKIEPLTKGSWQVEWAKWAPDATEIAYLSTQHGPAAREFYSIHMPDKTVNKVQGLGPKGMKTGPQMNEDGGQPYLLYEFSQWNKPGELKVIRFCPRCRGTSIPVSLTSSTPAEFLRRKWNEPKFIDIASRDGKKIPAKIYLPAGHSAKQKYAMVVFVHGAGYLQNVINGWNNYYREFMFNEMLTQKGYVVLDIDYRGSAGYGREWRTDVYDFLGGKDMDDHVDGIDYMVKNYGVNPAKVGVYGGSYGGFMAAMLAMRAPDKIAAAAALRPVFDWKNYYASSPGYTAQRLGFPDKNPEAYKRSSPITYADKLERPLLILHGMADDNVHVQDSVQLMEKLIRLGKTKHFEAMLYPSENHGFTRPESWTDEYERIFTFFEKHLK